ncbi:unnamed protein product [Rhizophagus irregularis]|nr:unnamed protein product [Rhizophagus irregularis]
MSYGSCLDCERQRISISWCKNCDIAFFKENFRNWTSGSTIIDEFIRHTQLNARGAFSSIYSAVWLKGPIWKLDEQADLWTRSGPIKNYYLYLGQN